MLHRMPLWLLLLFASASAFAGQPIKVGAERMDQYLSRLKGKNVGLVMNQTATVGGKLLVDTLLASGVTIKAIYAPEHGFRGNADAGEHIGSSVDKDTGIPVVSLYGKNLKPSREVLEGVDVMVFDMQDVGVRFYTYLSTLNNVMEACAKNGIPLMVLDRPNPNGMHVDGPILDTTKFRSFVGMNPIPIFHGMTLGELAYMINGEGWLPGKVKAELSVIPCGNYTHHTRYELPVKPSPNLPNMRSIYLYPSLCLFEGTPVSVGRGTEKQFQLYGYPEYPDKHFAFTPQSREGAKNPPLQGKKCYGVDLSHKRESRLIHRGFTLKYLLDAYEKSASKDKFFTPFFEKLAGTDALRKQIVGGWSESQIRHSWRDGLREFNEKREKYLLYE